MTRVQEQVQDGFASLREGRPMIPVCEAAVCSDFSLEKESKTRNKILDWLTPIDYGLKQSDLINRRQKGTGQWLLDSGKFKNSHS